MRNLKMFALVLFVGAIAFSSCKKDDPSGPTISVTPVTVDAVVNVATDVDFDYTISSNEKIKELTVTPNDGSISSQTVTTFNGDFSATGTITLTVPGTFTVGNTIDVVFTATDDSGDEFADTKTVTITIVADQSTTPLGSYSASIYLSNQSWATYSGNATTTSNSTIGIEMTGSTGTENTIGVTTAAGIVEITNVTDYEALIAAYDGGTPVTTMNLPVDDLGKAFSEKYLAVKVGTTYYLVHYTAGQRSTTTGNVVVFEYKTSS